MKTIISYSFCILFIVLSDTTRAQEVEIIRPLHFGEFVILDNSSQGYIQMDRFGSIERSKHFAIISPGYTGIAQLSGYTPYSVINVTAYITQANSISESVSSGSFRLTSVDVNSEVKTDTDGAAQVSFGGTIVNSGINDSPYTETTYTMRLRLSLQY